MLGALLRRNLGSGGNERPSNDPTISLGASGVSGVAIPTTTEVVVSELPLQGAPPHPALLDHLPDELKFKLLGSRSVPFPIVRANKMPLEPRRSTVASRRPARFRIIIMEEIEPLDANFKTLFDYSCLEPHIMAQIRPRELREYSFGSPIRSRTYTPEDKFRTIPNSEVLLVTRTFYRSGPLVSNESHGRSLQLRVAINICLPVSLLPSISEGWEHISRWLRETQAALLTGSRELDYKLIKLQTRVLPTLKSLTEIPRLFLFPPDFVEYVHAWFKDVFNWINIKDGCRLSFLPALLSKVLCDYQSIADYDSVQVRRIVVLSNNMVVANKLIFILGGILGPKFRAKAELKGYSSQKIAGPVVESDSGSILNNNNFDGTDNDVNDTANDTLSTEYQRGFENTARGETQAVLDVSKSSSDNIDAQFGMINLSDSHDDAPSSRTAIVRDRSQDYDTRCSTIGSTPESKKVNPEFVGWQIPSKKGTNGSVSVSSNESLAKVIQPSSLRSGGSSVHYLSTSLSSHPNSYGSWLNKRGSFYQFLQGSPNVKHGHESWEKHHVSNSSSNNTRNLGNGNIYRTTSSSSLLNFGTSAVVHTPQQSPSILEYEEYPWPEASLSTSPRAIDTISGDHITNSTLERDCRVPHVDHRIAVLPGSKLCGSMPLKDVNIERDCQRLDKSHVLDDAFKNICMVTDTELLSQHEVVIPGTPRAAGIIEIMNGELIASQGGKSLELLPRYTMYLNQIKKDFFLQALAADAENETSINAIMRSDLRTHSQSSMLVVSLQSREIKELVLRDQGSFVSTATQNATSTRVYTHGRLLNPQPEVEARKLHVEGIIARAVSLYEDVDLDAHFRDMQVTGLFHDLFDHLNRSV